MAEIPDYDTYYKDMGLGSVLAKPNTTVGGMVNNTTIPYRQGVDPTKSRKIKPKTDAETPKTDAETPWYKDGDLLSGYAGLASAATQLFALPSQIKNAKLQNKALEQNIAFANLEQTRRNQNIDSFNSRYT